MGKEVMPVSLLESNSDWNPFKKGYGYLGLRFQLALAQDRLVSYFLKDATSIFIFE
jgi:hypothetical protein